VSPSDVFADPPAFRCAGSALRGRDFALPRLRGARLVGLVFFSSIMSLTFFRCIGRVTNNTGHSGAIIGSIDDGTRSPFSSRGTKMDSGFCPQTARAAPE
jgi:hypothetical protein